MNYTTVSAKQVVENQQLDELKAANDKNVQAVLSARRRRFDRSVDSGAPNKEFYQDRRSNRLAARRNVRKGSNVRVDPDYNYEEVDLYGIILSHLLDEGYAETLEQAEVIMVNMSEGWREDIMEGMAMKDFKANRIKLQRKADSDDAKKRGHVDRLTGKPYGTEEAASRRKDIHKPEKAPEREARRRFAENPD